MATANVKIPSATLSRLKRYTGEGTGQKAVQKALLYFLSEARQRRITKVLETISFRRHFNPLALRAHER